MCFEFMTRELAAPDAVPAARACDGTRPMLGRSPRDGDAAAASARANTSRAAASARARHAEDGGLSQRLRDLDVRVVAGIGILFSLLLLLYAFWPEGEPEVDPASRPQHAPAPVIRAPPEIAEPAAAEAVRFEARDPYSAVFDAGRHPKEVMAFYGIGPGMTIVELYAQLGYYTELLSAAVGPRGTVYVTKLARPNLERLRNVRIIEDDLHEVPSDSVDLVFTHLNYHDLVVQKVDRVALLGAAIRVLKVGGTLGIVDHAAMPGSGTRDTIALHRIDEAFVRNEVQGMGFTLDATSDLLRRPADDHRIMVLDDRIRMKTDRFMLRFLRPAGLRIPSSTADYTPPDTDQAQSGNAGVTDEYYPEEPTE